MQPFQCVLLPSSPRALHAIGLVFCIAIFLTEGSAFNASIGVLAPLRWGGADSPIDVSALRWAASAAMAVHHINHRVTSLVPKAAELLPAHFKLVYDLQDSMALPSGAVKRAVKWNEEGRHVIVGSYRSAVTGPLALVASIEATPVIVWGGTASSLSDRATYPTLSRTVVNDAVLAESTIRAIISMGWTRLAIVYVNDAWGRAFVQDAMSSALKFGVEVVIAAEFALNDQSGVGEAVQKVADSGARIILCLAFESDLALLASEADSHGMLSAGYAWIISDAALNDVVALSVDPDKTLQQLTGWLVTSIDPSLGDSGVRFQSVLESEPLAHLNNNAFEGLLTEDLFKNLPCDMYCVTLYDAIWTAAIATSNMEVVDDGSVDKGALLTAIRNVSFEGASGRVHYDRKTGERDASNQPLSLRNAQQVTSADGTVSLSLLPVWRWQAGGGGVKGRLEREGNHTPVWPGGAQAWELSAEDLKCDAGSFFSTGSLQCEPCPKGTVEEDGACVRFDASLGVLVPLRWGGADSPMESFAIRWGAAAAMAVHHINHRVTSLVPKAAELLPANFKLVYDLQDSMALPSVAVDHTVKWNEEGRHAIVGSLRSAVTGPVALAASIAATPVISWASTASSLADRITYPTLGRTVFSDATLAASTIMAIRSMGWTRIAVMYTNDAWGRSLAQDLGTVAIDAGVEIVISVAFSLGDQEQLDEAVAAIADTGARIVLSAVYEADLATLAAVADTRGMLQAGFAWLVPSEMSFDNVVSSSPDPDKMRERFIGWISVSINPMYGDRGSHFTEVLESEPLQNLNKGILAGAVSEAEIRGGLCGQYCAALYDAVWTAAIAMSTMEVADDGSVDKGALLTAIREVSFEGATGQVQFRRETGERDAAGIPLLLQNVRPAPGGTGQLVSLEVAWEWVADGNGSGTLNKRGSESPYWPGGGRNWTAPLDGANCAGGFFLSTASLQCEPCPPGTHLMHGSCTKCPLGTFSSQEGAIQCSRCQIGYANETGMTACAECPANTVRSAASDGINIHECMCVFGYYSQLGPGHECQACVTGAECKGGEQAPFPVEGFWADADCEQFGFSNKSCKAWDSMVPCNPSQNCRGGPNFECAEGRTGRLCLKTMEGWSNVGGIFFWQCGERGGLITVGGMVAAIIVWFSVNYVVAGEFEALSVALMFVQTTAIIGSFGLKWHKNLHLINIAMNLLNFDVDFVAASCLMPWTPVTSFYFQLALPFMFGSLYMLSFLVAELWYVRSGQHPHIDWQRMSRNTKKYFVSFVASNYMTLALKCFQTFRCTSLPDGRPYMLFSPTVECWAGSHWIMVSLAFVYVFVILVGLPLGIYLVLRHHTKVGTLHSIETELQWSFIHNAYEADYKWWECVLIFRRFAIAFIAVLVPEPMLQGAATLIVLAVNLTAQTFTAPFIRADIDVLDFLAICGSMLYCLSGMLLYPSVTEQAQGHLCSASSSSEFCARDSEVKDVVSVVACTTIVAMVVVAASLTLRSIRERRAGMLAARNIRRLQGFSRAESYAKVRLSTNRVSLDQILDGQQLLKWSMYISHHKHSAQYKASSVQYLEVEQNLLDMDVNLTSSASHNKADVMRHLCELPWFADYLLTMPPTGVEALHRVVNDMALFVDKAEESHMHCRVNNLVLFEYRPILCYWLASTTAPKRQMFNMVVQAIQRANGYAIAQGRTVEGGMEVQHLGMMEEGASTEVSPMQAAGPDAERVEDAEQDRLKLAEHNQLKVSLCFNDEIPLTGERRLDGAVFSEICKNGERQPDQDSPNPNLDLECVEISLAAVTGIAHQPNRLQVVKV